MSKYWKTSKDKIISLRCPNCFNLIYNIKHELKIKCSCGYFYKRVNGIVCSIRPDLDGKNKCDYCGACDTGTDADFDTYAVQVQNGEGYYDETGTYRSYYRGHWEDY